MDADNKYLKDVEADAMAGLEVDIPKFWQSSLKSAENKNCHLASLTEELMTNDIKDLLQPIPE